MPTDRTPDDIAALVRHIGEVVMGWKFREFSTGCWWEDSFEIYKGSSLWSPWYNPVDALEVLERLVDRKSGAFGIEWASQEDTWEVWLFANSSVDSYMSARSPGPHFGPAVCRLAEKVLNEKQTI